MGIRDDGKPVRKKLSAKARLGGRTYLVLVAIYERDLDEAGINAFRVRARSRAAAEGIAERIVGTESWWEMVHGEDVGAREKTVYAEPWVIAIPPTTFAFRPLLVPKANEVGRAYGDDDDERLRAQVTTLMGKMMAVASSQQKRPSRSLTALDGGGCQP